MANAGPSIRNSFIVCIPLAHKHCRPIGGKLDSLKVVLLFKKSGLKRNDLIVLTSLVKKFFKNLIVFRTFNLTITFI